LIPPVFIKIIITNPSPLVMSYFKVGRSFGGQMSKRAEKEIEFYIEVLKLLVLILVAVVGGTISLLYKMELPISIPLIFLGAWVSFSLVLGIIWTTLRIKRLLEELNG
jgi:phosphoglycerol transferase MdoB-like AlkP superfamily enzyme